MKQVDFSKLIRLLPWGLGLCALAILLFWLAGQHGPALSRRRPGTDRPPEMAEGGLTNAVLAGKLIPGQGTAVDLPGLWPQFRGPERTGVATEAAGLARSWGGEGPRTLWSVELGEGYAGPVVAAGRVYIMDYDQKNKQDALRCLALADGGEIWRYAYPVVIKRNHGMSRTVPALAGGRVVGIGPKCHVLCLDAVSGELRWGLDMVRQFGATIPPWYTGQCPLVEEGSVILAPGGTNALLVAVDAGSGLVRWQTPNPRGWSMTHGSVMPMEFAGRRFYVYCASGGVVGVSAEDGVLLWENAEWKISIANVPSPVPLPGGRIFLSGGYDAGCLMLQLEEQNGRLVAKTVFRGGAELFGVTQHTPVFYQGYLYGIRAQPDDEFICMDLEGKVRWTSDAEHTFDLGPFLIADGLIYAMNGSGHLVLMEAVSDGLKLLAEAEVLKGRETWGPLALADGRLLARDLTRMICLDVAGPARTNN